METVPDTFVSLFWGYTVIWACILFYLVTLVRRVGKIEKDLQSNQKE